MTAFEDWQFAVSKASGRTKGGTLFDFESGEVPRLDLRSYGDGAVKKQLDASHPVTIYLAFSVAKPNSKNVSSGNDNSRYFEFEESTFDLHSGGNDRDIVFKKLKATLTCSDQKSLDFEYIPLAQICLLYTSPSPRDQRGSRMPSSA